MRSLRACCRLEMAAAMVLGRVSEDGGRRRGDTVCSQCGSAVTAGATWAWKQAGKRFPSVWQQREDGEPASFSLLRYMQVLYGQRRSHVPGERTNKTTTIRRNKQGASLGVARHAAMQQRRDETRVSRGACQIYCSDE